MSRKEGETVKGGIVQEGKSNSQSSGSDRTRKEGIDIRRRERWNIGRSRKDGAAPGAKQGRPPQYSFSDGLSIYDLSFRITVDTNLISHRRLVVPAD